MGFKKKIIICTIWNLFLFLIDTNWDHKFFTTWVDLNWVPAAVNWRQQVAPLWATGGFLVLTENLSAGKMLFVIL